MSSEYCVPDLTEKDVPGGACCVSETSFATLFPGYLETYISSIWPAAEAVLQQHKLAGKLDLVEGSMSVSTTRKTWDPYAIVKARDFIKLLARNVPVAQAQKIFQSEITCDIIKIGLKGNNTRRFVKRRDRLIGPQAQTLKAMEILTGCYVLVQGKTVAVMGPSRGCQQVRKLVEDCMRNIHPIYGLKQLLIRRELSKREDLKNEDWSRFLPQYKKTTINKEKQKILKKKKKEKLAEWKKKQEGKEKSIFPPAPTLRKEDIAMETGEAFIADSYRQRKRPRDDYQLKMVATDDDRIAELERQMRSLRMLLEEERNKRREEKEAADSKVRLLEAQIQKTGPKPSKKVFTGTSGVRELAQSTPRTADHLFVAVPSKSKKLEEPAPKLMRASASPAGEKKSQTELTREAAETALQHAWDKFCVAAREEFTPQELALTSDETLRALMSHFGFRNPVERAQIEGQWALLQEGKHTVGGTATPHVPVRNRVTQLQFPQHSADFSVDTSKNKPHLSRRNNLLKEESRTSNPNFTTSHSRLVRQHSATVLLTPRSAGAADPNVTEGRPFERKPCFKRSSSSGSARTTQRGMMHVNPPTSQEYVPRGIRAGFAHTDDAQRPSGIRTAYMSSNNSNEMRKGLRTFAPQMSPTRQHRPEKVVSDPPHEARSHLSTETLVQHRRAAGTVNPSVRSRAPFAVDY